MNYNNQMDGNTVSFSIVDFYIKYEKIIITMFVAGLLSISFYYLDWHNNLLWKEGSSFHYLNTWIDQSVPFEPEFVWLYLLYYPFCFAPIILLTNIDTFRRIALAYLFEDVIAFIVFIVYPTKMIRPDIVVNSISTEALSLVYKVDPGFNVFPSLHVANSLLVALIFYRYNKKLGILFILIAVLISISTLYVKQHYLLDIFAGVIDALVVYAIVFKGHIPVHKMFKPDAV